MAEACLLIGEEITVFLLGDAGLVMAAVALIMQHQRAYGGDQRDRSAA